MMGECTVMDRLADLHKQGILPGTERIRAILERFGNPQHRLRVVHIAGTNGKGSTARMICSIASAAGYRTGLYESPTVTDFLDTISIDGQSISSEAFEGQLKRIFALQKNLEKPIPLSEFETVTVAAILWFAEQKTDLCVIECGMGGREDATNVFESTLAAVITPVAMDHTAFLGNSLQEITRNKCGIFRPGCTVVSAPGQQTEALAVIMDEAMRMGLSVRYPNTRSAPLTRHTLGRIAFSYNDQAYTVPLTGTFQRDNALTALETISVLREKGYCFTEGSVQEGLKNVTSPCRQEVLWRRPLRIVDGAHNPHGVRALAETLDLLPENQPLTMVFGMLKDKDTAVCAKILASKCAHIVCCTPPSDRALPAERLALRVRPYCESVWVEDDPKQALRKGLRLAGDSPLLVAGSFTIASLLRPFLL